MSMIVKGDRIRAAWFHATPTCLAGMQPKFGAVVKSVTGTIRHVRGDDPVNPVEVRVYVDPDDGYDGPYVNPPGCTCSTKHVEIKPEWIQEKPKSRVLVQGAWCITRSRQASSRSNTIRCLETVWCSSTQQPSGTVTRSLGSTLTRSLPLALTHMAWLSRGLSNASSVNPSTVRCSNMPQQWVKRGTGLDGS